MYFPYGWPKVFALPLKELIIDVKLSPDGEYLAVLTESSLFIWSAGQVKIITFDVKDVNAPFTKIFTSVSAYLNFLLVLFS